jgi:DnaJ like chaperone protein
MCDPPSAAAISVLAGKLAGVDGEVNTLELEGFHELFSVPVGQRERLGRMMYRHGDSSGDFRVYAARFGQLHRNRPRVVGWALERLHDLALVDGALHPLEIEFLDQTATLWHLSWSPDSPREGEYVREGGGPAFGPGR